MDPRRLSTGRTARFTEIGARAAGGQVSGVRIPGKGHTTGHRRARRADGTGTELVRSGYGAECLLCVACVRRESETAPQAARHHIALFFLDAASTMFVSRSTARIAQRSS